MDPSIALGNLTSVPVLAFALGIVAARLRTDVRIPEPVYQVIATYLLLGIGIKGGVALGAADPATIAVPLAVTLALGAAIPVVANVLNLSRAEVHGEDRRDPGSGIVNVLPSGAPDAPHRQITLLQRKAGKPGAGLGKTTGWIHRAALKMKRVEMLSSCNYERITPEGLWVS